MIKSIATLSKENGMPCMMMNNGLYHLSKNNWLVVLNDKIVKAELSADESNVWHDTCINLAGKDVRMVQYINMDDMNYVVVGLENEIIVSDLDSGVELFHKEMSSEDVTCALISKYNLIIGTNLGRILRINVRESKDVDTEICQEFKISKNIWAICEFQDFLVISVESGALEFWKNNNGSWNCMKRTESKYHYFTLISRFPGTCMHAISCDFLLITRFHGAIDIINRDLNLEITLGAHTAYISGISFDSKRVIFTTFI